MRRLDWDSQFFGVTVAAAELGAEPFERLADRARSEGVDLVYLTGPPSLRREVETAIRGGALLVDMRAELQAERVDAAPDRRARRAGADDTGAVEAAAVSLSRWSRFRGDPRIPSNRIDEMYRVWARACLAEGVAVVPADGADGLVGVVGGKDAQVVLVYVSTDEAGRGLGRALVATALAESGARSARVATQAANVAALRLYESLGFRMRSVELVLHLWVRS